MLKLVLPLACLFSNSAHADVNLVGTIDTSVQIIKDATTGHSSVAYQIRVANIGDSGFSGPLHIKPFVITGDAIPTYTETRNGAVLKTLSFAKLDIAAGASVNISATSELPIMRMAPHLISAFINNDNAVAETNMRDNITDLVDLGTFSITSATVASDAYDLSSNFDGDVRPNLGGLDTTLRTIAHGDPDFFPSSTLDSEMLWARFMLADLKTKKITTAPYFSYGGNNHDNCVTSGDTIDKQWFAIGYSTELDAKGQTINVDYYHQAPCFADAPPANYLLLTLMNSRDLVPEENLANNLDVVPVTLAPLTSDITNDEIWLVRSASHYSAQATHGFHSTYMKNAAWELTFDGTENGLRADVTSGVIGSTDGQRHMYGQDIVFTWSPTPLAGDLRGEIHFQFEEYPGYVQSFPVRLFDYSLGKMPILSLPSTTAIVPISQNSRPAIGSFVIANDGDSAMSWKALAQNSWVELIGGEGTVPPRSSTVMHFKIHQKYLGQGSADQSTIKLLTSTLDTSHDLTVKLDWK